MAAVERAAARVSRRGIGAGLPESEGAAPVLVGGGVADGRGLAPDGTGVGEAAAVTNVWKARSKTGAPFMADQPASFQYPTPDGYPDEPDPWMGTLFWRWRFARALADNSLDGTRVDWKALADSFASPEAAISHALGRRPADDEASLITPTPGGAALALASPAFQKY